MEELVTSIVIVCFFLAVFKISDYIIKRRTENE